MSGKFTQGTIIEDIRSKKYPGIRCKGVVISARCDLEQDKIRQFHCLTALSMDDWIFEVLFKVIVREMENNNFGKIRNYAENKGLDFDTILEIGVDRAEEVLRKSATNKEKNNIDKWIAAWKEFKLLSTEEIERGQKKEFLRNRGNALLKSKIRQLYNSAFPKYAFIPEKAFSNRKSSVDGIVVDLQDVNQMDLSLQRNIFAYEYDYRVLKDEEKRKQINELFFFENMDDFIIADSVVESPWIEYILQLFANSFMRIGVDNALDDEIEEYCEKVMEENTR